MNDSHLNANLVFSAASAPQIVYTLTLFASVVSFNMWVMPFSIDEIQLYMHHQINRGYDIFMGESNNAHRSRQVKLGKMAHLIGYRKSIHLGHLSTALFGTLRQPKQASPVQRYKQINPFTYFQKFFVLNSKLFIERTQQPEHFSFSLKVTLTIFFRLQNSEHNHNHNH